MLELKELTDQILFVTLLRYKFDSNIRIANDEEEEEILESNKTEICVLSSCKFFLFPPPPPPVKFIGSMGNKPCHDQLNVLVSQDVKFEIDLCWILAVYCEHTENAYIYTHRQTHRNRELQNKHPYACLVSKCIDNNFSEADPSFFRAACK